MAVACGEGFTTVVTERGDLWAFGKGEYCALGLGTDAHQLLPALVGCEDKVFDGETIVLVAAGDTHAACVAATGTLWSWGEGECGKLGHGDTEPRQRPVRLGREMYGGSPAVMVACGKAHTLVLTAEGCVWSCGWGYYGQIGHGDKADKLLLTLVAEQQFGGAKIVMVAAGGNHSVTLGAEGRVWTWGKGQYGRLGTNDEQNRLVPTLLDGEALGGAAAVVVAAGHGHTVIVTIEGALWSCGFGSKGRLGLGDEDDRWTPTLVGAEVAFGGSQVLAVTCGAAHTLAVTKAGGLWSFGWGQHFALGHNDNNNRLVPTRIKAQHFGNGNIVSAAAGPRHSVAVTEKGILYTWGQARSLGHANKQAKRVPTPLVPHLLQGARVGRCHCLPPLYALAFAMGTHARLGSAVPTAAAAGCGSQSRLQHQQGKLLDAAEKGKDCAYVTMPEELVQRVVEACVLWPEGQAGELEGVVRLLGGGMMKRMGST